jgi:hypothetical protein
MTFKTIEEEWQGFATMVFGKGQYSDTQKAEMKKAFFAGYWALFCAVEAMGEPHVPEEFSFAFLDGRRKECEAFKQRMMAEYSERN